MMLNHTITGASGGLPVLLIHGENAHSRYFSETAYAAAAEPKEWLLPKYETLA